MTLVYNLNSSPFNFAILGGSSINGYGTVSNPNPGTRGLFFGNNSASNTASITTVSGSSTVTEKLSNDALTTTAYSNIITLKNSILALPIDNTLNYATYTNTNTTILAGRTNAVGGVTFTNVLLTFDALGDDTSQFFVTANVAIFLTDIRMNLINGAKSTNIFFVANNGVITFTNPISHLYGIYIAGAAMTVTGPATINGFLFAVNNGSTINLGDSLENITNVNTVTILDDDILINPSPVICDVDDSYYFLVPFIVSVSLAVILLIVVIVLFYRIRSKKPKRFLQV